MKNLKESSAPKKVRKNSKRTAKRRISNSSKDNRKLMAKRRRDFLKANYNARNIRKANWVYQAPTHVDGLKGIIVSVVLILSVLFTRRGAAKSLKVVSQTDGKKSTRRIGKVKNSKVFMLISLPNHKSFFVLATLPNSNMVITALLKMPKSYRLKGDWARARINACSDNPDIVVLPATIIAYLALLATFVTAQTNMETGTRGNKPIRDNAWKAVENALKALLAVAQAAANASPSTAIAIIESGLFFVKSVSVKPNSIFKVVNSNTLGTMNMSAPGASRIAMHVWEKSVEGIIWLPLGSNHKRKASYAGFTPVSKVWVRHRTDTNGVFSDWEYFYVTVN